MQQLVQLDVRLRQVPMPELSVEERIRTFGEVALGYSEEQALAESARCLQCDHPLCMEMCPLHIDIRGFIRLIRRGDYLKAAEKVREKNCLPSICGRVCPQEVLCMMGCKNTIGDPVNIGGLERFVADLEAAKGANLPETFTITGKSVAVVGSGPAGLSVAAELAKMGHYVVIFEALHEAGGVMTYGIPEFRLPKKVVKKEVDGIKKLGVEIKTNIVIGKTITIDELFEEGFQSVFIGSGAGLPKLLGIPGENLCGVYSLNEFLLRINLMKANSFPREGTPIKIHDKVAVLGARGLDAARCALRLGAKEVCMFYQWKVVGRKDEIRRGMEEGVKFVPLTKPLRLIGDEKRCVKRVELANLELGPITSSRKPRLITIEGSKFTCDAKTVVVASEHGPNTLAVKDTVRNIRMREKQKTIVVDPITLEAAEGVFAGGDVVSGASSVIRAIEAGKRAAQSINKYLVKSD